MPELKGTITEAGTITGSVRQNNTEEDSSAGTLYGVVSIYQGESEGDVLSSGTIYGTVIAREDTDEEEGFDSGTIYGTTTVRLSDEEDNVGTISGTVHLRRNEDGEDDFNQSILSATLSIRQGADGQDGKDGKDGFSPRITVHKDTPSEYILRITDVAGSYLTPNLLGGEQGGISEEEVKRLIAGKVDVDLHRAIPLNTPSRLTMAQRNNSLLYVLREDLGVVQNKIKLSSLALQDETEEAIDHKIRTVSSRPED